MHNTFKCNNQHLQPAPPKEIIDIVNQAKFRSLRLCILTLNQEMYTENASIYFPDSKFPFTRIYEPKGGNSMARKINIL